MNNIQKGGIFFLDVSDLMVILFIVSLSAKLLSTGDNIDDNIDHNKSKNKEENYDFSKILDSIKDKEKKPGQFKLDLNFKKELLNLLNTKEDNINVKKKIDEIYDLFKK